ncbi:MAG: hypothetical protein LBH42_03885 [Treponema sp.]|jgi:hypothetical protein|nr:hypothetical protein [Treponema sp.]
MKRLLVLIFILTMIGSFTMAEEIGLTLGTEVGVREINNINKSGEGEDIRPYIMPFISYEKSFFGNALEIYSALNYTFGYTGVPLMDGNSLFPKNQELYFCIMPTYSLFLGKASALSFILQHEFAPFLVTPRFEHENNMECIFMPAIKYGLSLEHNYFFFMAGVPIIYLHRDKALNTEFGLNLTAGWYSSTGLGLELSAFSTGWFASTIVPSDHFGLNRLEIVLVFEKYPGLYELIAEIPFPYKTSRGFDLIPKVFFNITEAFQIYGLCRLERVLADAGEMVISPGVGVKYKF